MKITHLSSFYLYSNSAGINMDRLNPLFLFDRQLIHISLMAKDRHFFRLASEVKVTLVPHYYRHHLKSLLYLTKAMTI